VRVTAQIGLGALILTALICPEPAFAQTGEIINGIEDEVIAATQGWQSTVMDAATSLFWILAGIEVGIAAIWLAIASPSLETWFAELVRRMLFIGFFLFVLQQGPGFAQAVVDSLFQLGADGGSASPAAVFDAGLRVANRLAEDIRFGLFEDNAMSIAAVFAVVVIVLSFSLIAAIFISVLVEMYVGLLAGMILLGLGGSSFTKDFAIKYLVYAFGVGMKLMALVMIARVGSDVLIGMSNDTEVGDNFMTAMAIAGISVVVFLVALHVPGIIQGVVQGVSTSNGMEAIRGSSQVATFAGAATSGIGAGAAAASAARASGAGMMGSAMAGVRTGLSTSARNTATDALNKSVGLHGVRGSRSPSMGLDNPKINGSPK
jgi:type IV secretion system protein TrbL